MQNLFFLAHILFGFQTINNNCLYIQDDYSCVCVGWLVSFTVKVSLIAVNLCVCVFVCVGVRVCGCVCVCVCLNVSQYLSVSFPGGLLMLNLISHASVTSAIRYYTHFSTQHTHTNTQLASLPQLCNQATNRCYRHGVMNLTHTHCTPTTHQDQLRQCAFLNMHSLHQSMAEVVSHWKHTHPHTHTHTQ